MASLMCSFAVAWRFVDGDPGRPRCLGRFPELAHSPVSLCFSHSHSPRLVSCCLQVLLKGQLLPESPHPHSGELALSACAPVRQHQWTDSPGGQHEARCRTSILEKGRQGQGGEAMAISSCWEWQLVFLTQAPVQYHLEVPRKGAQLVGKASPQYSAFTMVLGPLLTVVLPGAPEWQRRVDQTQLV